jgi:hypothetical protein
MTHEEALRKAMGCLRLAERAGTPDEAALAAAKAQKIIDDYKLDIENLEFDAEQLKEDKEEVKDFGYADPLDDVKYGNYRESWTLRLASIVDLNAKLEACEKENTKMLNALLITQRYLKGTDSYYLAISTDRKMLGLGQVIEAALPPNAPGDRAFPCEMCKTGIYYDGASIKRCHFCNGTGMVQSPA